MSSISLALLIFGVSYLVILTERIHKTIVALCGAAVMIGLGVVSQEEAFYSHEFGVDYNVVFLLIGMMVIINIVRETGLFEVLAIWAAQRADAKPFRLLVLLALLTAGLSAMLDNVTTVLLMARTADQLQVVADDSGCGEVIGQVGGGLVVALDSVTDLAAAIDRILDAPAEWRRAAQLAGARVRASFDPSHIAGRLEPIYREVIQESGARRKAG